MSHFIDAMAKLGGRLVYMMAGAFISMTLVQAGCTRPMLPGDRVDEDKPIEKLSNMTPAQIKFKQGRG